MGKYSPFQLFSLLKAKLVHLQIKHIWSFQKVLKSWQNMRLKVLINCVLTRNNCVYVFTLTILGQKFESQGKIFHNI